MESQNLCASVENWGHMWCGGGAECSYRGWNSKELTPNVRSLLETQLLWRQEISGRTNF